MLAYVGCRTTKRRNARGEGILVFDVDVRGKWRQKQCFPVAAMEDNPSYLCFDNERKFLYAVHGDLTFASSFRLLGDGALEKLNTIDLGLRNPVDITADGDNRHIIVATLQGGALCTISRNGGALGEVKAVYTFEGKEEGKVSAVHQCLWDRTKRYMIACAQGRVDGYGQMRVLRYDGRTGDFTETGRFLARTWDEPRHAAMHPNNRWLYMVEEKGNKVLYFRFDEATGGIRPMQELTTLPETETGHSDAGEVMLDPSGRYVVVSNRYADIMAIYTIEPETGYLHTHGFTSCLGKTPRFFCFGPDGHCYVANEDSDTIVDFAWDAENGKLTPTGNIIPCGSPTCVIFK